MPDKDRSSPGIFLPEAYSEGRTVGFLWPFGHFEESLMPECGQGFVKVVG